MLQTLYAIESKEKTLVVLNFICFYLKISHLMRKATSPKKLNAFTLKRVKFFLKLNMFTLTEPGKFALFILNLLSHVNFHKPLKLRKM